MTDKQVKFLAEVIAAAIIAANHEHVTIAASVSKAKYITDKIDEDRNSNG